MQKVKTMSRLSMMMREKWGVKQERPENDGTKYRSQNPEAFVHTDVTGVIRMKELAELEYLGAIIFEDDLVWRIKTDKIIVSEQNIDQFCRRDRSECRWHLGDVAGVPTQQAQIFFARKKGGGFSEAKENRGEVTIADMDTGEIEKMF